MDRRTRDLFLLVLAGLIVLTGAAAMLLGGTSVREPDGPPGVQSMIGVVVGVDSAGLARVRGFTLRTDTGESVAFVIGDLQNGAEFPPGHLVEHQSTAQRIRVSYRTEGATKVAVRLEDVT